MARDIFRGWRDRWRRSATRPAVDRRAWWIDAAVLAAIAVLLRLPAFLSSRHLTYDDGFFGLSAVEMRHGVVPFRDLFSPQGPLHLPLLYIADLLGLRTHERAPRAAALSPAPPSPWSPTPPGDVSRPGSGRSSPRCS